MYLCEVCGLAREGKSQFDNAGTHDCIFALKARIAELDARTNIEEECLMDTLNDRDRLTVCARCNHTWEVHDWGEGSKNHPCCVAECSCRKFVPPQERGPIVEESTP